MNKICHNCGDAVDRIIWTRICDKDEQWCISCIRKKYGCNCGKCEYCIKRKEWQIFQRNWNEDE